ncbi:hypothetical protein HMPREF1982_02877 [Clostridiales bacterium oral taxon 876 str. F0540]|nr:hypothetical protein HMPREF1982_02877 [Clostridiales bacterium oral taxon 876 str. F0540]
MKTKQYAAQFYQEGLHFHCYYFVDKETKRCYDNFVDKETKL